MPITNRLQNIVFLAFGLLPGFYFGSYESLIVLQHLMGGSVEPTVIVRMIMAVGIMPGIVCTASVSIVAGSILGTAMGYAVEALSEHAEVKEGAAETEAVAVKAK